MWCNDGNSELADDFSVILSLSQRGSFLSAELTGAEASVVEGVSLLFQVKGESYYELVCWLLLALKSALATCTLLLLTYFST